MSEECRNDCVAPRGFPKPIYNRPGLSQIAYRIGTYADFRDELLRSLNLDPILKDWTYREPGDPGIALLEGAAILGDILTFYQELYANEAYLGTAQWRESIADLVRLLGYRLFPGLGGRGTFAFGIKGAQSVLIPAKFPLKAQLEGIEKPVDFESIAEVTAYPHLSQFHLYRPRRVPSAISAGNNRLEIQAVGGATDVARIQALGVKVGDRLMLIPDTTVFDVTGTPYTAQQPAEILIVSKVEQVLDRTLIEFEGSLTVNRGTTVTAYRLGRSFKHFGHNAPAQITSLSGNPPIATQTPTNFARAIRITNSGGDFYSPLLETEMPLDQQVDDLAIGRKLICQGFIRSFGVGSPLPFTVLKELKGSRADSLKWGNLTGASTVVSIEAKLIKNENLRIFYLSDIRQMQFHEAKSPLLTLRAPTQFEDGVFTEATLNYFGTYDQVLALADRSLILQADTITQPVKVISSKASFSLSGRDSNNPWLWSVMLDRKPDAFLKQAFDEKTPQVTVYGNLVEAAQGKSETAAVLGNGDSRQIFQTFKLPKTPLTYFNAKGETPPEVPELQVYVNDRLWKRVSSWFNHTATEEIYIVREDANGESWVQFGDNKTGAKLPSGIGNVTAQYRTGTGAFGPLKPNTTVQAAGKLDHLDKVWLPDEATGGSQAESGENAREAAPGKIQSLGRLVSLKDFETETLAIAGVSKVSAAWQLVDHSPAVVLMVLMESGREQEIDEVQGVLNTYNRCRGPQRFPILVHPGKVRYLYVNLTVGLDPTFRQELVTHALKIALGLVGAEGDGIDGSKGLMGVRSRQFAQKEYATRIEGVAQTVEGVVWTQVTALGLALGTDPDPVKLALPPEPKLLNAVVPCAADEILSLYKDHLQLQIAATPPKEVC
jgi:hypothetical protein